MKILLWEYKLIECPQDASCQVVQSYLNKWGSLGWELVSIRERTVMKLDSSITRTIFVLKKPIGQSNML